MTPSRRSRCGSGGPRHRPTKETDRMNTLRTPNGMLTEPGRRTTPRDEVHVIWTIRRRRLSYAPWFHAIWATRFQKYTGTRDNDSRRSYSSLTPGKSVIPIYGIRERSIWTRNRVNSIPKLISQNGVIPWISVTVTDKTIVGISLSNSAAYDETVSHEPLFTPASFRLCNKRNKQNRASYIRCTPYVKNTNPSSVLAVIIFFMLWKSEKSNGLFLSFFVVKQCCSTGIITTCDYDIFKIFFFM